MIDEMQWAEDTFGRCELGDVRRTRRLVDMGRRLAQRAGESMAQCCEGDAAAQLGSYRFLRNERVDAEAVAETGFAATVRRAQETSGLLLAIEDTTTLRYSHSVSRELGPVGSARDSRIDGYLAHSVLLLEAESGETVGLVEQRLWSRPRQAHGQGRQRKRRAYGDKESRKWQDASQRVSERLGATMTRTISVSDRESDIYEYLAYKQNQHQRFVVRASMDRRTKAGQRLFERLDEQSPVVGYKRVVVAQRGGRAARWSHVALRAMRMTLLPPRNRRRAGPPLAMNVVVAEEVDPPAGAEPLRWRLLTSESIQSVAEVKTIVHYYERRWRIEEYHKAWKSGVGVERQRMQHAENLHRMIVITAFVAVRLLQLQDGLRPSEDPHDCRCDHVLDTAEWQVLWRACERSPLPRQPPTIAWARRAIAHLGGFTDTKHTGRAGWNTLWRGWSRLQDLVDGYRLSNQALSDEL